ncbi:hypothetical protein Gotur_002565 [Gossypium turneri]
MVLKQLNMFSRVFAHEGDLATVRVHTMYADAYDLNGRMGKQFFENSSMYLCRLFCCGLWAIWTARNKLLHEGQILSAKETIYFIKKYLSEIMGDKSKIAERIIPAGVWKATQNPFVKINFDVGFCKQDNRSCSGIIIRNDTDFLSMIHNLKENRGEQSVIGAYIHNICASCVIFQNCVFHHVQKHINSVAHALAIVGFKINEATYLVGNVPAYALDVVEMKECQDSEEAQWFLKEHLPIYYSSRLIGLMGNTLTGC